MRVKPVIRSRRETMNTEPQNEPSVAWWSPSGWLQKPAPEMYREAIALSEKNSGDWLKALHDAGYSEYLSYSGDEFPLSIEVYQSASPPPEYHLFVQTFDGDGQQMNSFFIAGEDVESFSSDWYRSFLRDAAVLRQAAALEQIAKTLAAFVRHGHGIETISESGQLTSEELRDLREPGAKPST